MSSTSNYLNTQIFNTLNEQRIQESLRFIANYGIYFNLSIANQIPNVISSQLQQQRNQSICLVSAFNCFSLFVLFTLFNQCKNPLFPPLPSFQQHSILSSINFHIIAHMNSFGLQLIAMFNFSFRLCIVFSFFIFTLPANCIHTVC